jgi:hypothetical protein
MCNCKKKPEVILPPVEVPKTPDELHTQEMNNYAKGLSNQEIDWSNNIDVVEPISDKNKNNG